MSPTILNWVLFNLGVLLVLALDLGVFHRKAREVTVGHALAWSGAWIGLALIFNGGIYVFRGTESALEFLTGYLIEKSLSIDNVFVFVLLFSYFRVQPEFQHRVLFWGILGALIMRGTLIAVGLALLKSFAWIIYVFGAFLILAGIRMAVKKDPGIDPEHNPVVRLFRKFVPLANEYHGKKFFVRDEGRILATPLMVVLLVVEMTDLLFALDSIPAIFAITEDPFIVYTSNVFAILGLRMLYFALAGIIDRLHYLKFGLAIVLVFVGIKMLLAHSPYRVPTGIALATIALILGVSVIFSLRRPPPDTHP